MSQKKTVVASLVFIASLLLGIFQNCSDSSNISQSDQRSSTSTTTTTTPVPASGKSCPGATIANCVIPAADHAGLGGACTTDTSGTCSYQCNNGIWSNLFNNCAPAPCAATTINGCSLSAAASGTSTGSCIAADKGSCAATCNNGNWTMTANSCTPKVNVCTFNYGQRYYWSGSPAASTMQVADSNACLAWCASTNAVLCQYLWVNYVTTCYSFSAAAAAAATYADGFAGYEGSGTCSYQ